jgi:hypothetical protein
MTSADALISIDIESAVTIDDTLKVYLLLPSLNLDYNSLEDKGASAIWMH